MKIGRLLIEKPDRRIESMVGACGCIFISTPIAHITWFNRQCRCSGCDEYICVCTCSFCYKKINECECEICA